MTDPSREALKLLGRWLAASDELDRLADTDIEDTPEWLAAAQDEKSITDEVRAFLQASPQPDDALRAFAEWIRDIDPTTTTWSRAKQWAAGALAARSAKEDHD